MRIERRVERRFEERRVEERRVEERRVEERRVEERRVEAMHPAASQLWAGEQSCSWTLAWGGETLSAGAWVDLVWPKE